MSMVVIAEVVTPEERAKHQGMLGSGVGSRSCLSYLPFESMVQSTKKGWRNGFYLLAPLWSVTFVVAWWFVPSSKSNLNRKEIVRNMDYLGVLLSSSFLISLLIPLDSGGFWYKWNSSLVIVFFMLSDVLLLNNLHAMNLLFQCVLHGLVFFSICFFFPFHCLTIREFSDLATAGYMQCILLPLAMGSSITGRIISKKIGNYNYVIWTGYTLWFIGS